MSFTLILSAWYTICMELLQFSDSSYMYHICIIISLQTRNLSPPVQSRDYKWPVQWWLLPSITAITDALGISYISHKYITDITLLLHGVYSKMYGISCFSSLVLTLSFGTHTKCSKYLSSVLCLSLNTKMFSTIAMQRRPSTFFKKTNNRMTITWTLEIRAFNVDE